MLQMRTELAHDQGEPYSKLNFLRSIYKRGGVTYTNLQQPEQHVLRDEKSSQHSSDGERLIQEAELEQLESDTDRLRTEIMNIQKEQENADNYLLSVKERLRRTEQKQQQMFISMAKAFQNPLFSEILMQQLRPKEALETAGTSKKQKLIAPQCNKGPAEASYYPIYAKRYK
ncbi:heat stress transcription factor A-2b-like [Apium graveolens]